MVILGKTIPMDSLRQGFKMGLASLLSFLFTIWFDLDYGYWAPITTVIVMQNNIAEAIEMSQYRIMGTAIGALMGVVSIILLPDTLVGNCIGLTIAIAICGILTCWSSRYRMAAITVTIVILASMDQPNRVSFGLFRVVEILVGVAAALLVTVFLWPKRAGFALQKDLMSHLRRSADKLETISESFLHNQAHLPPNFLQDITADIRSNKARLHKVKLHEAFWYKKDISDLDNMVSTLDTIVPHINGMLYSLNGHGGKGWHLAIEPEIREQVAELCTNLRWLAKPEGEPMDLSAALAQTDAKLMDFRREGVLPTFDTETLSQFYAFYSALHQLTEAVDMYVRARKA